MKLFGSLVELLAVKFRKNSQEITFRPNQATTYSASRDIQLPPGDAAHTLVSADSTQTLSNKTLTAPVISGGTIDNAVVGGTTRAAGNFTTVDANSTLSAVSVQVDGTSGNGFLEIAEQASSPSTPSSGLARLYPKSDGKWYTKNDDGTEQNIGAGSGSGEKNYVTNPSAATNTDGWAESGSGTLARTTTAANLPRENTTATGLSFASTTDEDYAYYRFILDDADLSKRLKVQLAYIAAAANFRVEVWHTDQSDYSSQTELTLSTDSSGDSYLPATTGVYTTTFDASTKPYIELRLVHNGTGNETLYFSDVIVGPGTQPQGAVVTRGTTYTPTLNSNTNVSVNTATYYRSGTRMRIRGEIQYSGVGNNSALTVSLPSGHTVDTSQGTWSVNGTKVGDANWYDNGTAYKLAAATYFNTTTVVFQVDNASGNFNSSSFASGDIFSYEIEVPIAEWAGSGVTNIAALESQYASNSTSTNTASDTTSFAYGPAGSGIPNGAVGTAYVRRVRFTTPIQADEKPVFEVDLGATAAGQTLWVDGQARFPNVAQGSSSYGVEVVRVTGSATDVDVYFNAQGYAPTNATYAGNGAAWSGISTWKWRVRKVSMAQAVGVPTATSTTGGLAPAGVFSPSVDAALTLQEKSATPTDPTSGSEARIYMKADKLVIQYNDGGTVRYKYLDLTGTGVTWVHSTSAP